MSKQELQTIDPAALAQVSGGTTVTTSSATNDQVLTALNGIISSIQSLTQNQGNSGGLNQQEMLMLMMVMQQRNAQPVSVASSWPWGDQQPIIRYY
jgi:hypothetical protein